MTLEVLNRRNLGPDWAENPSLVYVGRPSPWGNPFVGPRETAVAKYRKWARTEAAEDATWLDPLRNATALVCWCAPRACHADVLVELLTK